MDSSALPGIQPPQPDGTVPYTSAVFISTTQNRLIDGIILCKAEVLPPRRVSAIMKGEGCITRRSFITSGGAYQI